MPIEVEKIFRAEIDNWFENNGINYPREVHKSI